MLSPDNEVSAPDFTESYNRYSYVMNNPLKYTDPSGMRSLSAGMGVSVRNFSHPDDYFGDYGTDSPWFKDKAFKQGGNPIVGPPGTGASMDQQMDAYWDAQTLFATAEATYDAHVSSWQINGWGGYWKRGGGVNASGIHYDNELGTYVGTEAGVADIWVPDESTSTQIGKGSFISDNWGDAAFLVNDLAQAVTNNSSLLIAKRYNSPLTSVKLPPGIEFRVNTKLFNGISKVGGYAAKVAPWVAGGAIVVDVVSNNQITAGDFYQATVTGLSLIPGAGLIVGGSALAVEGFSYYFTGQSVSSNINNYCNGGVIIKW